MGLLYEIHSNYAAVKGFDENKSEVLEIPDSFEGKLVEEICENAFLSEGTIEKVIFGKNIKKTGTSSFARCGNLKEIVFNEGIEEIGFSSFENCGKIEKVYIQI